MKPVVVIFGATGGIGRSLVQELSRREYPMVIAARSQDALHALATDVAATPVVADVRVPEDVDRVFAACKAEHGRVDAAVNLVGSVLLKPAHRTTDDEWHDVIAQNLTSCFHVVRSGARAMLKTGGSIVLMSSSAGSIGLANHEAIAAAKAGVVGLARSAATTYAPRSIRVNAISPGLVETPMTQALTSGPARDASLALHASRRLGQPGDVARMIGFLVDPANDWVTGQEFGIDGGLGRLKPPPRLAAR